MLTATSELQTVVICNDFPSVNGGAAAVAIEEAEMLRRAGVQVYYVTSSSGENTISMRFAALGIEVMVFRGTELKEQSLAGLLKEGIYNRAAGRAIREVLERLNPATTVVHVHAFVKVQTVAVFREAMALGFPTVYTCHDYFLSCPNGAQFNFRTSTHCMLRGGGVRCTLTNCDRRNYAQKLFRVFRFWVQRWLIKRARVHIITISDRNEKLVRTYWSSHFQYHRLPNPINVPREERVSVEENAAIFYVGHLSKEKGPDLVAQAVTDSDWNAVFVGDGELRDSIRRIAPQAYITGWLAQREVRERLRGAAFLIFPSRWHEGQPLTPLEAQAMGIPVICSDGNAGVECISEGVNGFIFRDGDVENLKMKIRRLQDREVRQAMGVAAYDRFWNNYPTGTIHLGSLIKIYEAALSGIKVCT